jgi:two-component system CheB/CheR fusion protein
LAVAIAIIEQTRIDGRSPEELKDTLLGRLRAMARSYGAIARDNWKTVDIGELINQELEPFDERRYSAEGPSIRLKPRLALSLGMILHELATNAAKHGAFSTEQGTIKVSWSLEGETFSLTWQESGGPNTSEPDHHGFGLKLIANEARYNPGGEVAFNFRPEGVTVHLRCDL